MRVSIARLLIACSLVFGAAAVPPASVASSPSLKVAIIVGPVGSLTDNYRSRADTVAAVATAAGAVVSRAYSPRATWPKVLEAVEGANIIVYFGHGNGFPSPYSSTENTDRVNGWGLNRTTTNGDKDDWSKTLVYCGEKALLGTLSGHDGAAQRQYCSGGPIRPAPGFVMVYGQAHYAPGFGERYSKSDPLPTAKQARQRVRNYSYPVLALGGSAFYATAYGDAHKIVERVLTHPKRTYGWIFRQGTGYDPDAIRKSTHPDRPARIWIQKTVIAMFHFGQADYWYAFAGVPGDTPGQSGLSAVDLSAPRVVGRSPAAGSSGVRLTARPAATFSEPVRRINTNTVVLVDTASGQQVPASVTYNTTSNTARLTPLSELQPLTTYRVKLAGWIEDLAGNRLGAVAWKFTTGT